ANIFTSQFSGPRGDELVRKLRRVIRQYRPDLLILDPAFAYLDGDTKEGVDVSRFLRQDILPLAREFACLAFIVHHTNKPNWAKDSAPSFGNDLAYLGSGSAEWANAPRGIITL